MPDVKYSGFAVQFPKSAGKHVVESFPLLAGKSRAIVFAGFKARRNRRDSPGRAAVNFRGYGFRNYARKKDTPLFSVSHCRAFKSARDLLVSIIYILIAKVYPKGIAKVKLRKRIRMAIKR